jgi:hypothetical protein
MVKTASNKYNIMTHKTHIKQNITGNRMTCPLRNCLFAVLLLTGFTTQGSAQGSPSFRERLFFGGNFGIAIGEYTDIELSPIAGYYITPRWAAGIGVSYEYYNNKYHWNLGNFNYERIETHIWGGRLFTNYVIVNNVNDWIALGFNFRIFVHGEYEALSYEKKFFNYGATGRELANNFLVGGGLRFPMGKRSSMNLTVLWNLNAKINDFYGNEPVIRVGFNF